MSFYQMTVQIDICVHSKNETYKKNKTKRKTEEETKKDKNTISNNDFNDSNEIKIKTNKLFWFIQMNENAIDTE